MVFWKKGYVETSIDDLVEATAVNRYGLYAEFGSKHGLFLACLDYYQDNAVNEFFGVVEKPGASMPEIKSYFETVLNLYSQPAGKLGCLMCNSATEVAPHDKAVANKVKGALERLTKGFSSALINAQKKGEVKKELEVAEAADFLTGILLGASVMVRSGASKKMIGNTIHMSLASL